MVPHGNRLILDHLCLSALTSILNKILDGLGGLKILLGKTYISIG